VEDIILIDNYIRIPHRTTVNY